MEAKKTIDRPTWNDIINLESTFPSIGGIIMPFLSYAKLFKEEVRHNGELAPCRAKPKARGFVRRWNMTPEEILEKLKEWGLTIDRRTLTNYVKWGLITTPEQRSGGKGVKANYPEHAAAESAAAAELMRGHGWKKEKVLSARKFLASVASNDKDFNLFKEVEAKDFTNLFIGQKKQDEMEKLRYALLVAQAKVYWTTLKMYYFKTLAGQ